MMTRDADVVILGAGFGGCLTALVLERIGVQSIVIDRAAHPRFAIGESSTPIGNMVLRDLADRYDLPRLRPLAKYGPWKAAYPEVGVGRKRGFSYFHHLPNTPFEPDVRHANELLVAASSDSYYADTHWLRADVDALLADEVRAAGIPLLERTEVTAIERKERWQLEARRPNERLRCTADLLIDATGQSGIVLQVLGVADCAGQLVTRSRAIYGHFSGVERWRDWMDEKGACIADHPYPCDEAAIHHVFDGGWWWEFPFDDGRVSVGLVLDAERYPPSSRVSPEQEWKWWLHRFPALENRFLDATLVNPPGRLLRTGYLQRIAERTAGPGWLTLPFTAGFVDPLHSTGLAHTLCSIERLAHLVEQHGVLWPSAVVQRYDHAMRRELHFIDKLVATCYAALPSFRAWGASTMLYFAAATTYERCRAERDATTEGPFSHDFLCADDERLRRRVEAAWRTVTTWPVDWALSEAKVEAYEQFVKDAVRPYNRVGLFDPPMPNMYPHTAAP